jgi:hypothetical protein
VEVEVEEGVRRDGSGAERRAVLAGAAAAGHRLRTGTLVRPGRTTPAAGVEAWLAA